MKMAGVSGAGMPVAIPGTGGGGQAISPHQVPFGGARHLCSHRTAEARFSSMITILLIILILMLIGALPTWPHSAKWGYGPSGGLGTVLVILLILYLLHVI